MSGIAANSATKPGFLPVRISLPFEDVSANGKLTPAPNPTIWHKNPFAIAAICARTLASDQAGVMDHARPIPTRTASQMRITTHSHSYHSYQATQSAALHVRGFATKWDQLQLQHSQLLQHFADLHLQYLRYLQHFRQSLPCM